mgnify:CR=1 FL=1
MNKLNFGQKIKKLRNEKGWTQEYVAEQLNISIPALSRYESGTYEPKSLSIVSDFAKLYNVSSDYLLGLEVEYDEKDSSPSSAVVLVYGTIPAGIPIECIEEIIDTEEIPASMLKGGKQYFGLRIKGNSMSPTYLDGDTLILEKVEDCENGQDAVVMINGNDGTFKRVFKNENGIILQPLNPEYQPLVFSNEQILNLPVKIIGVAREIRRKI